MLRMALTCIQRLSDPRLNVYYTLQNTHLYNVFYEHTLRLRIHSRQITCAVFMEEIIGK